MKRTRLGLLGLAIVVGVVVGGGLGGAATRVAGHAACTAGTTKRGGETIQSFCGPARATVHFGGKTYTYQSGSCTKSTGFIVNVGAQTIPTPGSTVKTFTSWFGVSVGAGRDGTYRSGGPNALFINFSNPGASFTLGSGSLKLTANRSKGTFSGTFFGGTKIGPASGSFSC